MPLRRVITDAPTSIIICRFHNYHPKGCKKYLDPKTHCPLDHDHCHQCLQLGHIALECRNNKNNNPPPPPPTTTTTTTEDDDHNNKPKQQRQRSTKTKTKTKTVLGDDIIWMDQLKWYPPCWQEGDDQLRRCRKHKQFEANLLLTLPRGSSYVDVGSHFGDSVLTMAMHAKMKGREDLRFVALEPAGVKCQWIIRAAKANGVQIKVINLAIGDQERWVMPEINSKGELKQRSLLNGSMKYQPTTSSDGDDLGNFSSVRMTTLDHFLHEIRPMGVLHLDVEGMEAQALRGAFDVLQSSARPSYIIAEAWDDDDCRKRGVETDAVGRIEHVINDFNENNHNNDDNGQSSPRQQSSAFVRGPDMVDRGTKSRFCQILRVAHAATKCSTF